MPTSALGHAKSLFHYQQMLVSVFPFYSWKKLVSHENVLIVGVLLKSARKEFSATGVSEYDPCVKLAVHQLRHEKMGKSADFCKVL